MKTVTRILCVLTIALIIGTAVEVYNYFGSVQVFLEEYSFKWTIGVGVIFLAGLFVIGLCIRWILDPEKTVVSDLERFEGWCSRLGLFRWILAALLIVFPTFLFLTPWGTPLDSTLFRIIVWVGVSAVAALAVNMGGQSRVYRLFLGLLLSATVFAIGERLIYVTDYPFKLFWSEGNRIWDYSLYFGRDRYQVAGKFALPNYLTPGRHGLYGLPFLIPNANILLVRFWDALLWILPYFVLAALVFAPWRVQISREVRWLAVLWGFLYLTQGGIFAPLMVSAIIIALGYSYRHLLRSGVTSALGSFYAGISRWTWMFAPAMWIGLIELLEMDQRERIWRRIAQPAALVLAGVLGALASQYVLSLSSTSAAGSASPALNQALLWYRLFPNPTYPLGILISLAFSVGPMILLLAWLVGSRRVHWDALQLIGLLAVLGAFLVAGIVVSVKIGGGSNLHNLDMFLIGTFFVIGVVMRQLVDSGDLDLGTWTVYGKVIGILVLLVPAWLAIRMGIPIERGNEVVTQADLEAARQLVLEGAEQGEVLFIDQRQLLTFGYIEGVPLVMEYELKDMMNQAMAFNEPYFEAFHSDMAACRFSLIVSAVQSLDFQDADHPFWEENNAWVEQVTVPLLEYYHPVYESSESRLGMYAPIGDCGG